MKNRKPRTPRILTPESVLTTGQIAKILQCAPRTATRLIDTGKIKGHRLPGTDDRRVFASDLYNFLTAHNYPCPPELCPRQSNLAFGLLPHDLPATPKFDLYDSPIHFGAVVRHAPLVGLCLVGDGCGLALAQAAVACCRNWHPNSNIVLLLSPDVGPVECPDADTVAHQPADVEKLFAPILFPSKESGHEPAA